VTTAAATSVLPLPAKRASLVSGCHHYRVTITRGDSRADDSLVYSLYYPPHDGRVARIKERCVDNAARLDGQLWCAHCTAASVIIVNENEN